MKNQIDKYKSDFEKLSERPSPDLWKKLESKLESLDNQDKKITLLRWSLMAASLILFFGIILFINTKEKSMDSPATDDKIQWTKNQHLENSNNNITIQPSSSKTKKDLVSDYYKDSAQKSKVENKNSSKSSHQKIAHMKVNKKTIMVQKSPQTDDTLVKKYKTDPILVEKQESVKYITSEDLLFGRELDEVEKEHKSNSKSKIGVIINSDHKPNSIKVMGVEIYRNKKESTNKQN